jgi:hypothetical protein
LLSELAFGAFLQYSPRGQSEVSVRSRKWCYAVKNDEPGQVRRALERMAQSQRAREAGLLDFLGADVALVPAPRSAPLQKGALWPARRICEELVMLGLGAEVVPCVRRVKAVQKSAFAQTGERPTPEVHLRSMAIDAAILTRQRIVVVDDVVTKGATLLAAASLVKASFPQADVFAFGLVRTMGFVLEVDSIIAPCVGTIRRGTDGEAKRAP